MERECFEFEEFQILEAVGLVFHGSDFVVGVFQRVRGDGEIMIGRDAVDVRSWVLANCFIMGILDA